MHVSSVSLLLCVMVIKKMEEMGLDNLPQQHQNKDFKLMDETLTKIDEAIRKAPANKLIKDL